MLKTQSSLGWSARLFTSDPFCKQSLQNLQVLFYIWSIFTMICKSPLHLIHPASLVSHLLHLHDDRLEDRSGHEGGVLLPLLPSCSVLLIINIINITLGQKSKYVKEYTCCSGTKRKVYISPCSLQCRESTCSGPSCCRRCSAN